MSGDRGALTPDRWDRLGARLVLIWAGLSFGVAFLATPAKFLAPSLTLPVALDVGRQTFRIYDRVEFAFLVTLVVLAGRSQLKRRWAWALAVPTVMLIAEAAWLLPALDLRVAAIMAGGPRPPPSDLHAIYVAAEAVKLVWLIAVGLSGWLDPTAARP